MRHCSYPRSHAVLLFTTSIVLGALLLSACGQVVQGAVPSTAATSPLQAPFTLNGAIEQITQERWVVAGTPVVLGPQTVVTGAPAHGAIARIRGVLTADGTLLAQSITVDAPAATSTGTPAPTALPTATPPPVPTITPLPPGTVVNINGVIENIAITNNVTIIVVNTITYVLPHNFVLILGKRLRIGVPIVFVGQVGTVGQIVIINVTQINHQVIVVNPSRHHQEDDDDEGDE